MRGGDKDGPKGHREEEAGVRVRVKKKRGKKGGIGHERIKRKRKKG